MPITAIGVVSSASIVMLRGALGSCARGLRVSVRKRIAAVISWLLVIYILPTCECRVGCKYKPACDFDFAHMSTQEGVCTRQPVPLECYQHVGWAETMEWWHCMKVLYRHVLIEKAGGSQNKKTRTACPTLSQQALEIKIEVTQQPSSMCLILMASRCFKNYLVPMITSFR